jgi:large subunit ribosomal protein L15
MRPYLLRIPKVRGFKAESAGFTPVNLSQLQHGFKNDELVTPKTLRIKGIITGSSARVKILSAGTLEKNLKVVAHAFSAEAKAAIEKAGGTAEILGSSRKALAPKKQYVAQEASA